MGEGVLHRVYAKVFVDEDRNDHVGKDNDVLQGQKRDLSVRVAEVGRLAGHH